MQEGISYSPADKDFSYNDGMTDRTRRIIAKRAAELDLTMAEVSRAVGRNHAYMQQFMKRGVPAKLPEDVREKVAAVLKVPERDLRDSASPRVVQTFDPDELEPETGAEVPIVGYVAAGEAYFFPPGELDRVKAPETATPETVAVEIRGNSLGETLDRWLVFYDDVRRPVTNDLIGHLCVVGLEEGPIVVKKVRRAMRMGLFDLYGEHGEPMRGVKIEWAAKVKSMAPR